MNKKSSKKHSKPSIFTTLLKTLLPVFLLAALSSITIIINNQGDVQVTSPEHTIKYSEVEVPGVVENDLGELVKEDLPTVEEVDGGLFEDKDTGLSLEGNEYEDLGSIIEIFDTSTPQKFAEETLNRCIIANNKYGAQCVSYARSFWFSYAGRDVSTCGTGMAKGMMNCADINAGDDFLVMWSDHANEIQAGDWLVFDGGNYGHVGMALGSPYNGYVVLQGENQGGASCGSGVGGSAVNRINISLKNLIGFYRPKAYIKPDPTPIPKPVVILDKCKERLVEKGDTMSDIMKECEGKVTWGNALNIYADTWFSTMTGRTVFYGWTHGTGYGLLEGDTIKRN